MSLFRLKGYLYPFEQDHATGVRKTLKMLILHLFQPIQSHRQHFSTVSLATRWLSISATNSWCKSLTSITIPNGMTSVRYSAFSCCESLTSIKIPNGVTSIGKNAFYGCESLTSITIPESVTSIGNRAFSGCESLKNIMIPKGTTNKMLRLLGYGSKDKLVEIW